MTTRHRRLGAGQGQRARPDGRGRPARRRGRRRLRRRGAPARRGRRRGARRPRRRRSGPRYSTPTELRERAAAMHARLEHASRGRCRDSPISRTGCARLYDALRRPAAVAPSLQRIHGDLHLGQALRTVARWVVIDFEGEPLAELERSGGRPTRRCATSPACCARSSTPATTASSKRRPVRSSTTGPASGPSATAPRSATATPRRSAHDPREQAVLLRAFEADKAVYEAVYEARNRPTWLPIPLASP